MTTKQIPQLFLSRSPLRNTVQIANEYHFIGIAIQRKLNKSSSYNFQICTQSIVASHKIIYTKDQQIANVYRGPKESIKTPLTDPEVCAIAEMETKLSRTRIYKLRIVYVIKSKASSLVHWVLIIINQRQANRIVGKACLKIGEQIAVIGKSISF